VPNCPQSPNRSATARRTDDTYRRIELIDASIQSREDSIDGDACDGKRWCELLNGDSIKHSGYFCLDRASITARRSRLSLGHLSNVL
jgi:hypothetical protein